MGHSLFSLWWKNVQLEFQNFKWIWLNFVLLIPFSVFPSFFFLCTSVFLFCLFGSVCFISGFLSLHKKVLNRVLENDMCLFVWEVQTVWERWRMCFVFQVYLYRLKPSPSEVREQTGVVSETPNTEFKKIPYTRVRNSRAEWDLNLHSSIGSRLGKWVCYLFHLSSLFTQPAIPVPWPHQWHKDMIMIVMMMIRILIKNLNYIVRFNTNGILAVI